MADLGQFEAFRGRYIRVDGCANQLYVPTVEQEEDFMLDTVENMCFDEDGYQVVAIEACIEEGELVQSDGLFAVNETAGCAIHCEEGTSQVLNVDIHDLNIQLAED